MRSLVLNVIAVGLTAALGTVVSALLGSNAHVREMMIAGCAALIVGELALVPMIFVRQANQLAVSQAALLCSMIHLFATVSAAAIVILGHLPFGQAFLYWLMAFYWVTLVVLVTTLVRAVKAAPPLSAGATKTT